MYTARNTKVDIIYVETNENSIKEMINLCTMLILCTKDIHFEVKRTSDTHQNVCCHSNCLNDKIVISFQFMKPLLI